MLFNLGLQGIFKRIFKIVQNRHLQMQSAFIAFFMRNNNDKTYKIFENLIGLVPVNVESV